MKKVSLWLRGLSLTGKITLIAVISIVFFGVVGATAHPTTPMINTNINQSSTPATKNAPKIEIKTETTTESIPYTSSTVEDSTLGQDITQIQTKGINGVLTHTYQVTYTNGVETSRGAAVDSVTTPAINEVITQGTKVPTPICNNGTYVNSAGNTVCSPYSSSTTPSGATAQCVDGTYSFSQSRSGTCSHHGGVSIWL